MRDRSFVSRASLFAIVMGLLALASFSACGSSNDVQIPPPDGDSGIDSSADAPDDSSIGSLGSPCDKPGALACAGHAQKLQLICDGGVWKSNGVCAGAKICDSRPGPSAGTCVDPDPNCVGKKPGEPFCDGAIRRVCGADLLDSTSATCASPEHCAQGTGAKCAQCLDLTFVCEGATLKKCAPDRQSYVLSETCATEALCIPTAGKCTPPACAVGDYRCDGDTLQTCKTSRDAWDSVKVCPTGLCNPTAKDCSLCVPGTKDCAVTTPRTCDSTGHFVPSAPCSGSTPLCKAGACVPGVCATGEYRCNSDILETCNSTLSGWDPVKICYPGMCDLPGKECDDCKPGTSDCLGSTPRSCSTTGHWTSLTPCGGTTPVCKAGVCSAGICLAGDYRCTGDILETCASSFLAYDPVAVCGAGLCDALGKECDECKSGSADCVGTTPRACDSTGHWKSLTTCSGSTPVCVAGVCKAGLCVADEYRCSGDNLEVCSSTFMSFDYVKTCPALLCDAAGKGCFDCLTGAKDCVGTTPRLCDSTGHWSSLTACSGSTPYCSGGVCVTCPAGLTNCSGSCVDITSDSANCGGCGTSCASGWMCIASTCVSKVTFNATGTGATGTIQTWTVPATGTFTIEAWGAQGGVSTAATFPGGKGAYIKGDFSLTVGTVVKILVGQTGLGSPEHGGGGGGSFVVTSGGTALVVAGGGGGLRASAAGAGGDGQITTSGQAALDTGGAGGTSGGGGGISSSWGSGGGGFSGDGTNDGVYGFGGKSYLAGGVGGGKGSGPCGSEAQGGFGGGGAGNGCWGGGGGGGYSGGGGGFRAGGGGSFNGGTAQTNTAGVQYGSGKVVITSK